MKYEEIPELRNCPICGSHAIIRKNASKRFQVKCSKCNCCTAWASKPQAIISWYNNAAFYEAQNGTKRPEEKKRNVANDLTEAGKTLLKYANDMNNGALINLEDISSIAHTLTTITQKE